MAIVTAQEASSSTNIYNYQVFLSFRGEDTRNTFTDHLYASLIQSGIRTFRDDDEIQRGRKLELELHKAIKESRVSIIVLSKNYAFSKWCLNEVEMIMEWSRTGRHEVLPVFYDVDPSDVRNQTGNIGEAFASYEKKFIDTETDVGLKKEWIDKLKRWTGALEEVANLTGMVLQNQANGHEARFIQKIVKEVELKLNRAVSHVGSYLVGMLPRVESINTWVRSMSSAENITVICGISGIGKTTIANFVYNSNFQRFEGHCFLAKVNEKAQLPSGIVDLQMQLLSSILNGKKQKIYDANVGVLRIDEAIRCRRVLVVIDDVEEFEHVEALLGTREFYPGSKIIITTRKMSLLRAHDVHQRHIVNGLNFFESLELFSWHAFGKEIPNDFYQEQSERAVYYCGGVPLALKILGRSLAGWSPEEWVSTLDKLEAIPDESIMNILKVSFDYLQDAHDRNLFLHIACFFVGEDKYEICAILDECGFFTSCGIANLVDRCLISIDWQNKITMHQLLQVMGTQIADQESPNEPGRRSRLWHPKDSFSVLKDNKGTEKVEGLILDMQMYKHYTSDTKRSRKRRYDDFCDIISPSDQSSSFQRRYFYFLSYESSSDVVVFKYAAFSNMVNLRLLKLNYTKVNGWCHNFPEGLRWLCWHEFPLKSIPFHLNLGNLVSLDMRYSKLENLWFGNKVQPSLKFINLSYSERLVKTPNFGRLPNLEKLILEGCLSLVEVCHTLGNLDRLVLLNLKDCRSLKKLPNIEKLNSLNELVVDGCLNLFGESPQVVDANEITAYPSTSTLRGFAKSLLHQWVSKPIFRNPEHIRVSFPHSLVKLSLRNCNLLDDGFPFDLSSLSLLKVLDLSYNRFRKCPSFGSLDMLEYLELSSCTKLNSISGLPCNTEVYMVNCMALESVSFQGALTDHYRYTYLDHNGCSKLKEIEGVYKVEPLGDLNRGILDSLGLCSFELTRNLKMEFAVDSRCTLIDQNIRQGLYEFGIFSVYLKEEEIPSWCIDGSNKGSSSVSIIVPSHPSLGIQGLNMYIMYTNSYSSPDTGYELPFVLYSKIENKSKGLCWIYTPIVVPVSDDKNEEEMLVWVSHWKFGNHQLESGDELVISVIPQFDNVDVKEFGIHFVWDEAEEDEMNSRVVVGGDLSSFEFTKGVFIFSNLRSYTFKQCDLFPRLLGEDFWEEDIDDDRWNCDI